MAEAATLRSDADRLGWSLATESIVVKIRWFGIVMGLVLVQSRSGLHDPVAVTACLLLGAGYAALDTLAYRRGTVFLHDWPLFVAGMEATFIALLCYHDTQLASPFRWYYLLSIICCAIRYDRVVAWTTCGLHCLSFTLLAGVVAPTLAASALVEEVVVIFACVTWASSNLAAVLRSTGARLERLNAELREHRAELAARVDERTAALRAAQARVLHQEKMAAFGLLAAGIAHEVGNPLTGISSLIQMIRRRDPGEYVDAKLALAESQLARIQRTIRDLIDFSRPASTTRGRFRLAGVVDEALGIAKYYQRTVERVITTEVSESLPPILGVRDHLMQVILNLVLNAIDATGKGGHIRIEATPWDNASAHPGLILTVTDDGRGIAPDDQPRLFQPYFTTKPQGTGLGLFVSRQIVEEMGGTLDFESEAGTGTTFRVVLPADRAEALPSVPARLGPVSALEASAR